MSIFRIAICLLLMVHSAFGTTYFVNNETGKDTNDGRSKDRAFATIARTVKECKTSDKIVLANTGVAYREQLRLTNLGGTPAKPFVVEGNGAVLNGFKEIQSKEWESVGNDVYFKALVRRRYKKTYLKLSNGKRVYRLVKVSKAEELKPGEWFATDKGIYFKCNKGEPIDARQITGICYIQGLIIITNSSYIICRNLIIEYSLDDGIDGRGDCRGLFFENIESRYNSCQPISFHDRCEAVIRNAYFHHNGTGIVDVNHSRTSYYGVLVEENESGSCFNGGYHEMIDCVLRNNGKGRPQLGIRAIPVKHLLGYKNNPLENTSVFLKNVVISSNPKDDGKGISISQEGVNNQLIMENCVISGCKVAIQVHTIKPTEDSFCHITASAFVNCKVIISKSKPETKFRFYGDYNVYNPASVYWSGKKYSGSDLESFLKANGSDKESKIGTLILKDDGGLVDESGSLLKGKLRQVGPTYWLNTNAVFDELKYKNVP
jgi:hypothetical protein